MFIFNLLFVITGIVVLSIGLVVYGLYHGYEHFLDNKFFSVPSLLIAVGTIIFFIAFFACCGAMRENRCMIITFATLLILVFILELSAGIAGYVLRGQAADLIETKMRTSMEQYNKSEEIKTVWDTLQIDFDCCGTNNSSDWKGILRGDELPPSCCRHFAENTENTNVARECTLTSKDARVRGCFPQFLIFAKTHAVELGGAGIGVAFVQAIGIWLAIHLARSLSRYETV